MKVHLVGSVGLADAASVFATVADVLGPCCPRIPDGETGARSGWVRWQSGHLAINPALEVVTVSQAIPGFVESDGVARTFFRIRDPALPLELGSLKYAREAIASWGLFQSLEAGERLQAGTRFQISLPTPVGLACAFFLPEDRLAAERAFEVAILRELDAIQQSIPAERLAIQWDTVFEVVGTEVGRGLYFAPFFQGSIDRLVRLCDHVNPAAELGIHLCYGDAGARHLVESSDLGVAVRFVNAINQRAARALTYAHMPVPIARSDDAYFEPLARLDPTQPTRLVLGLVHDADGLEGTVDRIAAARRHAPDFDIGTECGFGRRAPETILPLLELHRALCESV